MKRKIGGARKKHIVGYKLRSGNGQYLSGFSSDELSMTFKIQTWWEDEAKYAMKFVYYCELAAVTQLIVDRNLRAITVVKYYDEDRED